MSDPIFIVGTGRCGSTLLSNMLNLHHDILSISEFFSFVTDLGTLIYEAFPEQHINGEQFWEIISCCYPKQNIMLKHDIAMDEVRYPFHGTHRFDATTGVPAILQTSLPHITSHFDTLFVELQHVVIRWESSRIDQHYRNLFTWLQQRFGKLLWVERSGGSLRIAHRLMKTFPEARFIHLVRHGHDCALSMQKHTGFKMALVAFQLIEILGVDPYESKDRQWISDLPDELVKLLPEHFSAQAFRDYEISPSLYGYYWSGEITAGLNDLDSLPVERCHTLRYEDLLQYPEDSLTALMMFINTAELNTEWLQQAIALIRTPGSHAQQLPAKELSLLSKACEEGFNALKARGIVW